MSQTIPGPLLYDERSSSGSREIFAALPVGLELQLNWCVFFDDFLGIEVDGTNEWTEIIDTDATATVAADVKHGVLLLSNVGGLDNCGMSLQANEVFQLTANKRLIFEARVSVLDADDVDFFVGLAENHATNPEALASAIRIGFQINEGNASILCKGGATAGAASADSGVDAVDDTMIVLSMVYDGEDLKFYVNRSLVATMEAADLPTGLMTPSIYFIAGAAAADTVSMDYILVAAER